MAEIGCKQFLSSLFKGTFGMEKIGTEKEWGLRGEWDDFCTWPSGAYIRQRPEIAVDDRVIDFVGAIFAVALHGRLARFQPQVISRNVSRFVTEVAGVDVSALEQGYDEDEEVSAWKADALRACVMELCTEALDKTRFDPGRCSDAIRRIVVDRLRGLPRGVEVLRDDGPLYQSLFNKPLHLEGLTGGRASLSDLFVEPGYDADYWLAKRLRRKPGLMSLLNTFASGRLPGIRRGEAAPRALTVLAHAGGGKTSVVAKIVSDHAKGKFAAGKSLFCLKASQLASSRFYSEYAPLHYLQERLGIPREIMDDSVIVLDGLDELCLLLSAGDSINEFFRKLIEDVYTYDSCRLIVTSRFNYISPYAYEGANVVVELEPFDHGRCMSMVRKWCDVRKPPKRSDLLGRYEALLDSGKYDFVGIPLMLYTTLSLGIDVSDAASAGDLFDSILEEMSSRSYGTGEAQAFSTAFDPRRIARAFAVEMRRRSDKCLDSTAAAIVLNRLDMSGFTSDEVEAIRNGFALSFFCIDGGDVGRGEFAPEFVHRSFVDFLSAEEMYVNFAKALDGEGDESDRAHDWWRSTDEMLGGAEVGNEVAAFFEYQVQKHDLGAERVSRVLMEWLGRYYLPFGMIYRSGRETGENSIAKSRNMFLSYWKLAKAVGGDASLLLHLGPEMRTDFVNLMNVATPHTSAFVDFGHEDFCGLSLYGLNVIEGSFEYSDFSMSRFTSCTFPRFMRWTDFSGAALVDVRFHESYLIDSVFKNAKLRDCSLFGADISGTDFEGVAMKRVCLAEAYYNKGNPPKFDKEDREALAEVYTLIVNSDGYEDEFVHLMPKSPKDPLFSSVAVPYVEKMPGSRVEYYFITL